MFRNEKVGVGEMIKEMERLTCEERLKKLNT